jgi:hypothetical protein
VQVRSWFDRLTTNGLVSHVGVLAFIGRIGRMRPYVATLAHGIRGMHDGEQQNL